MTDLHRFSIREMAEGLKTAQFSSRELTQHYLDRIAKIDSQIKSYITVTAEQALAEADQADQLRQAGQATTLTGIPLAHKDIFCTQGIRTSAGSKMLDNFIAPYDATVVSKTKQAGLITLGKVNMDEFAMGSTSESSYYGATRNPWNLDHVPGGSSGGSAAVVAADLAPFATGTDTGGSIRQPASFCGLTGLKPTYGRVSRFGIVAFASSLDQAGPMARSAEDCAYLMNTMAGHDAKDSTSINKEVDAAYEAHYKVVEITRAIFEEGNPCGIKAVLNNKGVCEQFTRLPLIPASEKLTSKITLEIGCKKWSF